MTKTIHAQSAFSLTLLVPTGATHPDGKPVVDHLGKPQVALTTVSVPAGVSIQPDEVADHWFTKAHLSNGGLGAPAYAQVCRAAADQAFIKAKAAEDEYYSLEQAAQEAEKAAALDPQEPAKTRLSGKSKSPVAKPADPPKPVLDPAAPARAAAQQRKDDAAAEHPSEGDDPKPSTAES